MLYFVFASILVSIVAGLFSFVAYWRYLAERDISFFSFENHGLYWDFMLTPLGIVLTVLEIGPWVVLLLVIKFVNMRLSSEDED